MTEYNWTSRSLPGVLPEPDLVELVGWNPKLHPRGWGGRFGLDTKAASSSPGVKYVDHPALGGVKPKTKMYSKHDVRAIEGRTRAQRVAGTKDILSRTAHIKPTRETKQIIRATKRDSPISRVQPETRLPSRIDRTKLRVGAKIAGTQRKLRERQAAKGPKFKRGEYVSIQGLPQERTLVDKVRRRDAKARTGQVHSKRPDGKYIVRTVDGNRDVFEAVEPNRMTVIRPSDGDPAPIRPSKELSMRAKIERARRVYGAYKAGS